MSFNPFQVPPLSRALWCCKNRSPGNAVDCSTQYNPTQLESGYSGLKATAKLHLKYVDKKKSNEISNI